MNPDFDAVLIGQNLGVYTFARALGEEYGVRPKVVAYRATGPLWRSRIIEPVEVGVGKGLDDIRAAIVDLAERRRHEGDTRRVLLTGNADGWVRMLASHREELERDYVIPLTTLENIELVSDKAEFARLAAEVGIGHPRTEVLDLSDADAEGWVPPTLANLPYPVVAKAAESSAYEGLQFAGKKKVYVADDAAQLATILRTVAGGGYRSRFVVQEVIPGDDTNMRWINCYRDRSGRMTTWASAQVLLEEHTPWNLGNPAAMITTDMPEARAQVERLLEHLDWVGFANFDGKVDPRDGELKIFEFNPRMGRANWAATAAGANVARFVVEDWIYDRQLEPQYADKEVLFTIVPVPLLLKYVTDPVMRARVKRVARNGLARPFHNPHEGLARKGYWLASEAKHIAKYRQYYPWGVEHSSPTGGGTA